MTDFILWFQRLFIEPTVTFAGTELNLLKLIGFLSIWGIFMIIGRFLRLLLRRFLPRLGLNETTQARTRWLVFLIVVLIGSVVGLAVIGINLAIRGKILTYSIPIGETTLSLAKALWFLGAVIGSLILSKYLQVMLRNSVLPPFRLTTNAEFLILRLIHISIVILGVLIGINLAGLGLTNLAVVVGGLGIGIGFGLQNIASNLASGWILIFERPIRVGDQVTVGEMFGTVSPINMRSTLITTLDNIDIIVPNSKLVEDTITNWTYRDKLMRIRIPIGVAYGSDTALVKQALLEVAHAYPQVIQGPDPNKHQISAPLVRFINFGDSSLDFELLAWIPNVERRFDIMSDLHFMIDQKFREYNITIPFPQRDVHLYTTGA